MSDSMIRKASAVANKVAMLQFAWESEPLKRMMDRIGVSAAIGYFSVRVAPLGPIPATVAQAMMPFFPTPLVAKMVEKAWASTPAAEMSDLVFEEMQAAADAVFGGVEGVEELADLFDRAVGGCDFDGRPLAASWSTYAWTTSAGRLFGSGTVLREYRGEGHWFALAAAGVSGDEAHVLGRLMQGGGRDRVGHGYRPEQVGELIGSLEARGWIADDAPTDAGREAAEAIEAATDALVADAWEAIGQEGISRVIELGESIPNPLK